MSFYEKPLSAVSMNNKTLRKRVARGRKRIVIRQKQKGRGFSRRIKKRRISQKGGWLQAALPLLTPIIAKIFN